MKNVAAVKRTFDIEAKNMSFEEFKILEQKIDVLKDRVLNSNLSEKEKIEKLSKYLQAKTMLTDAQKALEDIL